MSVESARPIAVGTRIGPYEIAGWIGAGGMGEVYRARDARLGREVAIKLIPAAVVTDASRVHRFEQEARAAGQLNHPNILAVYDVGTHDGAPYIVSELLEGETLGDRLRGGALQARKALGVAHQIAEGLAAAHGRGIVHRDLKPDNLFLTSDGRVKILDFGVAKLARPEDEAARQTGLPTETAPGMVMGTAGYMSPEQARGEAVDPRSDLFSFGSILYEMLAGRAAFTRPSTPETMTAIIKEDPPPLPATVPAALERIVSRCLEKTREARFQSARDLAFGLELSGTTGAQALAVDRPRWPAQRALPWALSGALALGLAAAVAWNADRPVSPPAIARFPLTLPADQQFDGSGGAHIVAMSPDGSQLAYLAQPFHLYLRSMSELDVKAVPGTGSYKGVREPVFSPDGRSIAFFAVVDQTLKRMAVTGGAAQTICAAESPTGISWGPDGILFGQGSKGISRVAANGGAPEVLVRVKDGETAHGPQLLPGGRHVLFTLASGSASDRWDKARIVVYSVATGEQKQLMSGGSDARYVPTGHLVYALSGSLHAVAFDLDRLAVRGDPVAMVEGVARAAGAFTAAAQYAISDTGALIYVPGPASTALAELDVALADRQGNVEPLNLPPGSYSAPRVSPDGTRIAFGNDDDAEAIVWIHELAGRSTMRRLASVGNNRFPTWTADNNRIAYQSDREGDAAIWWQPADGSGSAERLTTPAAGETHAPESWSPDGSVVLFSIQRGREFSLATLSLRDRKVAPFGAVRSSTPTSAVFSPDGRWVAYSSTERSLTTVYVEPFPASGSRYSLFARGSDLPHHPRWSPDGTELFYNPRVGGFEVVSVTTRPAFGFGTPMAVPRRLRLGPAASRTTYDVMPSGKLVGIVTAGSSEFLRGSFNELRVVLHWFEELKRRVPQP